MTYSIILAGSTEHTRLIAETLQRDSRFEIKAVITPNPRPIGRQQIVSHNPLHQFAEQNQIPAILVDKKLDQLVKEQFTKSVGDINQPICDFLLVVDFGYYVPSWVLQLAKIAPLNIHPSKLPRWRGSSPGQFVLLTGETDSAVSLITVAKQMDQGDLWKQLDFPVDQSWDTTAYYQFAFNLIATQLPELLAQIGTQQLSATVQTPESPTPTAVRFNKADSFLPWTVLMAINTATTDQLELFLQAQTDIKATIDQSLIESGKAPILAELLQQTAQDNWATAIERAIRAFQPWPKLWSLAPTTKGKQRVIVLNATQTDNKLTFTQMQIEGKTPASFNQLKTSFV